MSSRSGGGDVDGLRGRGNTPEPDVAGNLGETKCAPITSHANLHRDPAGAGNAGDRRVARVQIEVLLLFVVTVRGVRERLQSVENDKSAASGEGLALAF